MDVRLNKKAAALAGGVVSMACLVACGDDITQITNVGMDTVAAYEDLSECTDQNEGVLIYVKDKGNTYLCSDESWHSVKGEDCKNGSDGKNGTNGKNVSDDNSGTLSVVCGPEDNPTSTATIYKAVCGKIPYDPAVKFCFNMELIDLCDGEVFDPTKFKCVENQLHEKVLEKCGDAEYDPDTHFCAMRNDVVEGVYRKVTIGDQTWMAENLNYNTENSWCGGGSETTEGDCSVYGRLYTYDAAKAACPEGWHLPTKAEFETLITSAGGSSAAGKALKSSSGWKNSGNGTIDFAFSALPAGFRNDYGGYFNYVGYYAYFWSSTEYSSDFAYVMYLYSTSDGAFLSDVIKYDGYSVRCLKD